MKFKYLKKHPWPPHKILSPSISKHVSSQSTSSHSASTWGFTLTILCFCHALIPVIMWLLPGIFKGFIKKYLWGEDGSKNSMQWKQMKEQALSYLVVALIFYGTQQYSVSCNVVLLHFCLHLWVSVTGGFCSSCPVQETLIK